MSRSHAVVVQRYRTDEVAATWRGWSFAEWLLFTSTSCGGNRGRAVFAVQWWNERRKGRISLIRGNREIATSRALRNCIQCGAGDCFVTHVPQAGLERLETRLEIFKAADAHVADPENVALQRALSARDDRPVLLSKFLPERGIVHAHRITDCGHRIGCKA